jgi:hypothetical protein
LSQPACFLPAHAPIVLLMFTYSPCDDVTRVDQTSCSPLHLRAQNVSEVGVLGYHLGLLLIWRRGEQIEIQFWTFSLALFRYFF